MISHIHPIPAFTDNYIWAISEADSNRVCVVDPGDATAVIDYLQANDLELSDILVTHHHADHTGGLAQLRDLYAPRIAGPIPSGIEGITVAVAEGDQLTLFGCTLEVLEVPGHTLDHIAYHSDLGPNGLPILFCGDTLFAGGCGRLFEGSPAQMQQSLAKLTELNASSEVYCTHEYTMANLKFAAAAEPSNQRLLKRITEEQAKRDMELPTLPSTLQLELETNPFLRCSDTALIASAKNQLGHQPADSVEVFAAIRQWKDNF